MNGETDIFMHIYAYFKNRRQTEVSEHEIKWKWLRRKNLKRETESLFILRNECDETENRMCMRKKMEAKGDMTGILRFVYLYPNITLLTGFTLNNNNSNNYYNNNHYLRVIKKCEVLRRQKL